MQSTRDKLDLRPLEVAQLGSPETVAVADQDHGCVPMAPAAALPGGGHQPLDFARRLDTREFELRNLQLLVPPARPSVFPRYFPLRRRTTNELISYFFLSVKRLNATQRQRATASGSRHSHSRPMRLVRTAPIDRAARIIDSRCQREGARFSISVCLAQHQPASSEVDTSGAALAQRPVGSDAAADPGA